MRWLALLVVLCGCGDASYYDPCSKDDMPIPPSPYAQRFISASSDTLMWKWNYCPPIIDRPDDCFQYTEVWVWSGCNWEFEEIITATGRP